jgi:hypothetical protein
LRGALAPGIGRGVIVGFGGAAATAVLASTRAGAAIASAGVDLAAISPISPVGCDAAAVGVTPDVAGSDGWLAGASVVDC